MSTNGNDIMKDILSFVESATKLVGDAQRARAMDELMDKLMKETVLPRIEGLANAPVWETLKLAVQDAVTQRLEEDSFSPCEAAKPAHHLLQALDTIERGGAELRRWAQDDRFKLPKQSKTVGASIRGLLGTRPQPPVRVPVGEIVEQLAYMMGLLGMAGQEAHLASETILRVRDPRTHIALDRTAPKLPHIEAPRYLIPLPTSQYQSQGDKGRDLLQYLEQFSDLLIRTAERGRERIQSASIDNKAFSPGVVAAEAIAISLIVTDGLATCEALTVLAGQFTGDSVVIEYND